MLLLVPTTNHTAPTQKYAAIPVPAAHEPTLAHMPHTGSAIRLAFVSDCHPPLTSAKPGTSNLFATTTHHPTPRRDSCIHPSIISSSYIQRCTARYALSFHAYGCASQFCYRREQQAATRNWPSGRSPAPVCATISHPFCTPLSAGLHQTEALARL